MTRRKHRKHGTAVLALAAAGLAATPLLAAPQTAKAAPPAKGAKVPTVRFEEYRLANGLRVILAPDKSAPVVAVSVTYNVGSRNERAGRTGFAHLFEHMMFQGSENVGKGEHFLLISTAGGTLNGTTNQDRTNYFETLPANALELGLFLEADRMRSLDVSQANLDNQRSVVQEERRQRYDNSPYGQTQEAVIDLAYSNFAYKHSTIGSLADLDAATLADVRQFFDTYYAPNNAALAVAGDFDTRTAKRLIEKYFGPIARKPDPPAVDVAEPAQAPGERRKTLTDRLARQPQWRAAYKTVPGNHPDYYALSVLGSILSGGRTSRLYQAITEKNLALGAGAGMGESRGDSLFNFTAQVPAGGDVAAVEAAIDAEVARIQAEGVTEAEVRNALTGARVGAVGRYATALGKANALSQYAVYYNDPNRVNTYLTSLQAVTAADVQRVAKKYLTKENRVVVITLPEGGATSAPVTSNAPAAGKEVGR